MVYALIPDSNIINLGNYSRISIYPHWTWATSPVLNTLQRIVTKADEYDTIKGNYLATNY